MKSLFIILLSIILLSTIHLSCHKDIKIENLDESQVQLFKYSKTPCFGFCEVYSFVLFSNNVACLSLQERNAGFLRSDSKVAKNCRPISTDIWNGIKQKAVSLNLKELGGVYPDNGEIISDASSTMIEITLGDEIIKIKDTYGAPITVTEFEKYVEKIIKEFNSGTPDLLEKR